MAYPINSDVLSLFTSFAPQLTRITVYGQDSTITLTEGDVLAKGFTIDRYCVSGNRIELGSAIAGEATIKLDNYDGRFNDIRFEGADLYIQVGVKGEEDAEYFVPMGYFTVDTPPRKLASITLTALDRMVLFDKPYQPMVFPMSISELLSAVCNVCNVETATVPSSLTNADYIVTSEPEGEDITYRQILQWICEITGTCAYIDWEGKLRLEWYSDTSEAVITAADRFSSDIYENVISITGVQVVIDEDNTYTSGEDEYAFQISDNALLQHDHQSIADSLAQKLTGTSYVPYTCNIKPYVQLYPMDRITFKTADGKDVSTVVTNYTFSLNGILKLQGKGETQTNESYAQANPLTQREKVIINTIKKVINQQLNDSIQSAISLNEAIAGSLGLYTTKLKNSDGSVSYYFHSNPVLQDSIEGDVIYTMVAGGFAVCTTGWNEGAPVWTSGFTKDGNAVFRNVSVYGIEVSTPDDDYTAKITPQAFEIWYRAVKFISANADQSSFTKLKVNTYLECGKVRLIPKVTNGTEIGTDLVFLD